MRHDPIASGKRKSVNLTMDSGIVAAAREAGVNLSQVSEAAHAPAWKGMHEARWKEENREGDRSDESLGRRTRAAARKISAVLMAKFDVHRGADGEYWLDCQANLLERSQQPVRRTAARRATGADEPIAA